MVLSMLKYTSMYLSMAKFHADKVQYTTYGQDCFPSGFSSSCLYQARSALLVPKANRMSELTGHDVLVFASISNGRPCLMTSYLTNLAPATVEKTGRYTNIALKCWLWQKIQLPLLRKLLHKTRVNEK